MNKKKAMLHANIISQNMPGVKKKKKKLQKIPTQCDKKHLVNVTKMDISY